MNIQEWVDQTIACGRYTEHECVDGVHRIWNADDTWALTLVSHEVAGEDGPVIEWREIFVDVDGIPSYDYTMVEISDSE